MRRWCGSKPPTRVALRPWIEAVDVDLQEEVVVVVVVIGPGARRSGSLDKPAPRNVAYASKLCNTKMFCCAVRSNKLGNSHLRYPKLHVQQT
jgi:hypothetical protein